MRRSCILALIVLCSSVLADPSISRQFSGVQRIVAPNGSTISTSQVFIDEGRLRLEILQSEQSNLRGQVLLVDRATGVGHLLSNERMEAMRIDPSRPIHYMLPDFMMVALLFEERIQGQQIVRTKLREEQVANQSCDVLEVTMGPGLRALVFVNRSTRLPVRVHLGPESASPRAECSDVTAAPQDAALFVVPSEYTLRAPAY